MAMKPFSEMTDAERAIAMEHAVAMLRSLLPPGTTFAVVVGEPGTSIHMTTTNLGGPDAAALFREAAGAIEDGRYKGVVERGDRN
jgi:hypothetical protein